jgi:hypothetical protein
LLDVPDDVLSVIVVTGTQYMYGCAILVDTQALQTLPYRGHSRQEGLGWIGSNGGFGRWTLRMAFFAFFSSGLFTFLRGLLASFSHHPPILHHLYTLHIFGIITLIQYRLQIVVSMATRRRYNDCAF